MINAVYGRSSIKQHEGEVRHKSLVYGADHHIPSLTI